MKKFIALLSFSLLTACATTQGTASQQYINIANTATQLVDQVVLASDAAVKSGYLKGQDAVNVLKAINTAQASLKAAAVVATTDPANAALAVNAVIAAIATTQATIIQATMGATK